MNVFEIYQAVHFALNKDQVGDAYSPDEFNLMMGLANIDYLKQKYGLPEEYQPGVQLPRQAWSNSQKMQDDLKSCLVNMGDNTPPLYVNSNGFADLPEDYIHQSTVYSYHGDIEVLNDDDFSGRLFTYLRKPTKQHAICRFLSTSIQFAPKNIGAVKFTYIRMPRSPFMDYNIVNDEIEYLPEGATHDGSNLPNGTASRTVQLEWSEQCHSDIVNLLVGYGSKNLRDNPSYNWTEQRKIRGV